MSVFEQALQSGSGKFLKFPTVGTSHTIKIERVTERQATTYVPGGKGEPRYFPSGDPILEPYISGKSWSEAEGEFDATIVAGSRLMQQAIAQAVKDVTGAATPQPGGVLTVEFDGYGQGKNPANPPKSYKATYKAPEPVGDAWGAAAAQAEAAAPAAQSPWGEA